MLRKRHIGIYIRSALIAGSLLFCACNKDEMNTIGPNLPEKSEYVTFGIRMSDVWGPDKNTKAPQQTRSEGLPMEFDGADALGTEVKIYMVEEDLPAIVQTKSSGTKAEDDEVGIIAYQLPNLQSSTENDFENLKANAQVFMNNINLSTYGVDGGTSLKYWPGASSWLKFFAYSPYTSNQINGTPAGTETGLSIANIDGNQPQFVYMVPDNVSEQIDLMEGTSVKNDSPVMVPGNDLNTVTIELNHILTQIQVKAGTFEFGKGYIKSVSFKNIPKYGTKNLISGSWTTNASSKGDFTQNFATETSKGLDLTDIQNIGEPYFFIPQTLPNDATIEITLVVNSVNPDGNKTEEQEYTLSKKLAEVTPQWAPNKKYTYVISTPEEVEVEVTDDLNEDQTVKSNLQIRNTGLAGAYIRAAIVGSWIIPGNNPDGSEDRIVADWNPDNESEGKFVWGADNSGVEPGTNSAAGWEKYDGYYYHLNLVPRGEETSKLFESYTIGSAPVPGAVLDLTILVQAILPADIDNSGWPEEIRNKFTSVVFTRE